jgi:hypothetical protein
MSFMLSVAIKPIILSVVVLIVVAPNQQVQASQNGAMTFGQVAFM